MRKLSLFVSLVFLLGLLSPVYAGKIPKDHFRLHKQIGSKFYMYVNRNDRLFTLGHIQDADKAREAGFKDVLEGDKVTVLQVEDLKFEVFFPRSEEERIVTLRLDQMEGLYRSLKNKEAEKN